MPMSEFEAERQELKGEIDDLRTELAEATRRAELAEAGCAEMAGGYRHVEEACALLERNEVARLQSEIDVHVEAMDLANKERDEAVARVEAKRDALRDKAQALVDKLHECEPHISSAFLMSQIHGIPYTGPQYGEALDALEQALKGEPHEETNP